MANELPNGQSKPIQGGEHESLNSHVIESPSKTNAKRKQFLAMLKSRYSYTNDEAVDELKRLLKQFHITNRSLILHRPRQNFKDRSAG
jgi:hypothetical protein